MSGLRAATLAALIGFGLVPAAHAQDAFLGEIKQFAFNFCPRGWLPTDGRLMALTDNVALYSLLGTTYGGDGRATFALPRMTPLVDSSDDENPVGVMCIAVLGIFPNRN